MKKYLFLSFVLLSSFMLSAQNIGKLINTGAASRLDTIIRFNNQEFGYLPLSIINGKEPGPVFTIIAGIHGYEYPPIIAVQNLLRDIDPAKIKGTLIILPVANTASFYRRTAFVNPADNKNLNNAFPGSATGTITDKIANWVTKQIIARSSVFLDIHGGDAGEDLLPFVCYYDNKNNEKQTMQAKLLAEASGIQYIVSYPYTISKTETAKYAFKQAVQDGITALSIEAGKLGNVQEENVQLIKEAVYNMLDQMEIYKKPVGDVSPGKANIFLSNQEYIKSPGRGIFYSTVKSGDKVEKDDTVGYINNEYGQQLYILTAPVSGTVLYKTGTPPVNKGETVFCIGF